jgi:cyclophilin family peptidyl-prolyl cis-trans isomerase
MADVFISYAREDRDSAKRLAEAIGSHGWTVWWDRRIPAGKSYEDVIQQAIDDAGCVVVLWTRQSVASEWVRNEAAEAARRKVLIPIRLEDVRLPLSFRHLQADDLFGWTSAELEGCLDSIESMIGGPAKRASEPSATVDVAVSVPVETAAPLPPPVVPPERSSEFKRVRTAVAIVVGLFVLIVLITYGRKQEVPVNTDTSSVDTSSTDTAGTMPTDTAATAPVSVFTTDTTSTAATTTSAVAVAGEVVDFETSLGKFSIELFPDAAPNHVSSFLRIARSGGFDGTPFYYVSSYGVNAGGVSKADVPKEPNDIAFLKGTVMAVGLLNEADRSGNFYIATQDALSLDRKKNTVFGRVIAGMDVVDNIAKMPVDADKHPLKPISITRAVVRKRDV